jgi:hypothetical protein
MKIDFWLYYFLENFVFRSVSLFRVIDGPSKERMPRSFRNLAAILCCVRRCVEGGGGGGGGGRERRGASSRTSGGGADIIVRVRKKPKKEKEISSAGPPPVGARQSVCLSGSTSAFHSLPAHHLDIHPAAHNNIPSPPQAVRHLFPIAIRSQRQPTHIKKWSPSA